MGHLSESVLEQARATVARYPEARSALIPLCHLAQEQDGYLTPEAIEEIADLVGVTPAEVAGTASFYDMLHLEPVGRYLVGICTNIACLLAGGVELVEHAEERLGVAVGETTEDGLFTLEETECLAHCDKAPAVQVNYRFFDSVSPERFDQLTEELRSGALGDVVPPHGTLSRVKRTRPLLADPEQVRRERAEEAARAAEREQAAKAEQGGGQ